MNCLTTTPSREKLLYFHGKIRRLTPTECERLQGIEENKTSKGIISDKIVNISDTQRYIMLGMGFTIPVIKHLISSIYLKRKYKLKLKRKFKIRI